MDQWEVRWRTQGPHVTTLDDIMRLPLAKRPAVVLPIFTQAHDAAKELNELAKIFPGILLTINGTAPNDPYTSQLLVYARRGFSIQHDNTRHNVWLGVKVNGDWTPAHAYSLLGRVKTTVGEGGIIEGFFPDDLPARLVAGRATTDGQEWNAAARSYRSNNALQLYTPITPTTRATGKAIAISDGIILDTGTQTIDGVHTLWRGIVNRFAGGNER